MANRNYPISIKKKPRFERLRHVKDALARYGIAIGGISVIFAVLLIFAYLFAVVFPLFKPAKIEQADLFRSESNALEEASFVLLEEQEEILTRFLPSGQVSYVSLKTGKKVGSNDLGLPEGVGIAQGTRALNSRDVVIFALTDGSLKIVKQGFKITLNDNDERSLSPFLEFPYGEEQIDIGESSAAIDLTFSIADNASSAVVLTNDNRLKVLDFELETSLLGASSIETNVRELKLPDLRFNHIGVSGDQRWLFASDTQGGLSLISLASSGLKVVERKNVLDGKESITSMEVLLGGVSVLVGLSDGGVEQWFPVRDEKNNYSIEKVRSFASDGDSPVTDIITEYQRKGFVAAHEDGAIDIYLTTASRHVLHSKLDSTRVSQIAIAPRSKTLITEFDNALSVWHLDNEHPEISWSSLWGKVWYEGYSEPTYTWQSSAANDDFEPKFSLMPLTFGTLKAAFYAMMVAMPLAIFGAIFTAYFMGPSLRQYVKPSIEIMEALPTVILGFLAGLWLAPFAEKNLPGIFILIFTLPIAMVVFGFVFSRIPQHFKNKIPDGWHAALLIPLVMLVGWISIQLSLPVEDMFFGGDIRIWFREHGIGYDQRNALVVGAAMGFAVIPTIFSITEDAIFSVPGHLSKGSLALGATPWQTLVGVVLPAASPAIFSAVMIGFGRAVGETMIVLMATGNTPVMDWNIFEGMRTLSANIAVEMPESEVGSTHYRVLFLAGLVLLIFTFILNSVAEIVRNRLRKKYSAL